MVKEVSKPKKLFLILTITIFILLFSVNLISSAKTEITQTNLNGFQIFYPDYEYVPQGQDFSLHIQVSNISTGFPLKNNQAVCKLHLYNTTGSHTFQGIFELDGNGDDWELYITKENFSDVGEHSFYIWCNNSVFGGEAKGTFYVNPNGEELTEGKSITYFLVTLFAFGIFGLLLYLFLRIDGMNPKNELKEYIGINYKKYLKVSLIPLVYVSFIWAFNLIIGLSNNFLGLTLFPNTLAFIFLVLIKLVYPVIVLTLIILVILLIKDSNIKKEYKSLWSQF